MSAKEPAYHDFLVAAKRCILFDHLPAAEVKFIFSASRLLATETNSTIYTLDDAALGFYLVHTGHYRATMPSQRERESFKRATVALGLQGRKSLAVGDSRKSLAVGDGRKSLAVGDGRKSLAVGEGRRDSRVSRAASLDELDDSFTDGGALARDYGPGDNFGASELLVAGSGGRKSKVRVLEGGVVWYVPQRIVAQKLAIPPPIKIDGLLGLVKGVRLFAAIAAHKDRLVQLCRGAKMVAFEAGVDVFTAGDVAHDVYVVHTGLAMRSQPNSTFRQTLHSGDLVGETALFAHEKLRVRNSTLTAGEAGVKMLRFDVTALESLVGYELQDVAMLFFNRLFLASVTCAGEPLGNGLRQEEIEQLVDVMTELVFQPKQCIVSQGDLDDTFFLIKHGSAAVVQGENAKNRGKELTTLVRGDAFGEQALLPSDLMKRTKRKTSIVVAGSEPLIALGLTRYALTSLRTSDPLYGMTTKSVLTEASYVKQGHGEGTVKGYLDAELERSQQGEEGGRVTNVHLGIDAWAELLEQRIADTAVAGFDGIVREKVTAEGGSLEAASRTNDESPKKKGKRTSRASGSKTSQSAKSLAEPSSAARAGRPKPKRRNSLIDMMKSTMHEVFHDATAKMERRMSGVVARRFSRSSHMPLADSKLFGQGHTEPAPSAVAC